METKDIKVGDRTLTRFSAPFGFMLYRGVVILCDGSDEKVVGLIDSLAQEERNNLAAVEQHEGEVRLAWRYSVPKRFALGKSIQYDYTDGDSDTWIIDGAFEASAPA
jgi:hypothetical protein